MTSQKPSAIILVIVHSILLLGYALYSVQNPFLMIAAFVAMLSISGLYQLLLWLVAKRRPVKNIIRVFLYFAPVIIFVLLGLALPASPQKPNQTSPLVSPSSNFTMKMDITNNHWVVSIFDAAGHQVYQDNNSKFPGHLNVYWAWDKADRLWLYNSDDGAVYYWTPNPKGWRKTLWEPANEHSESSKLHPPILIYLNE